MPQDHDPPSRPLLPVTDSPNIGLHYSLALQFMGIDLLLIQTNSTADSRDLAPLPAIFAATGTETDAANLNLNPCISNTARLVLLMLHNDVFSRAHTFLTKPLSYGSLASAKPKPATGFSQQLQVMNIPETLEAPTVESVEKRLRILDQDLHLIMNQFNLALATLTKAAISFVDCLKKFVSETPSHRSNPVNCYNNNHVRRIVKLYLNFYDNLLADDVFLLVKLMLVKNFNEFCLVLDNRFQVLGNGLLIKPRNYAVGNLVSLFPRQALLSRIVRRMATTPTNVKEQNGAFIAPISRGVSPEFRVLCLHFGYPLPLDYHRKQAQSIGNMYDDIHVVVTKNHIEAASLGIDVALGMEKLLIRLQPQPQLQPKPMQFKLPFRTPLDPKAPPMGLSLSTEALTRTLGTVGGYIYPIIDLTKQAHVAQYANCKFAISCGHVCLEPGDSATSPTDYAHVLLPSLVLIGMYKNALTAQYSKAVSGSQPNREAAVAYSLALHQLEELFPVKKVKSKKPEAPRNLPRNRFGQIIWGERTLIPAIRGSTNDKGKLPKRLLDLAIIKVNKKLTCHNYLGDDIAFNEFDPALMFENLYVRAVVNLTRTNDKLDLSIDDVDDEIDELHEGLLVFKYGLTTKYTRGTLNGIRMVYWLDGAIQSLEFVVNAYEANLAFAAGGDSGAWIFTKLEDMNPERKGLGVVGMLHSFDGEFKQFGLFSPMKEILERLEEVTSISWAVVGVPNKHDTNVDDEQSTDDEYVDRYGDDSITIDSALD